jgi:hypothetical protein
MVTEWRVPFIVIMCPTLCIMYTLAELKSIILVCHTCLGT